MSRFVLVILMLAATAGAVVAYKDPEQVARASDTVSELLRRRAASPGRAAQIARGQTGEFTLKAKINGVTTPMVIDTGATWVVLPTRRRRPPDCRLNCSNTTSRSRPPADTPGRHA